MAYLELHYELRQYVQLWIMPLTKWCPLLMLRFILWRRWGVLAGILPGPPTGVFTRSQGVRQCNAVQLALHFRDLVAAGQLWPAGNARVVVTGTRAADLALAIHELPPWDRQRLVPFLETLSELRTTANWSRHDFNQAPLTHTCTLVARALLLLQAAGLPQANQLHSISENSLHGGVFRKLHSGSKF